MRIIPIPIHGIRLLSIMPPSLYVLWRPLLQQLQQCRCIQLLPLLLPSYPFFSFHILPSNLCGSVLIILILSMTICRNDTTEYRKALFQLATYAIFMVANVTFARRPFFQEKFIAFN